MKTTYKSILSTIALVAITQWGFAQDTMMGEASEVVEKYSPYTDPVFYALAILALVLLIFIMQLQKVFTGIARAYSKNQTTDNNNAAGLGAIILLVSLLQFPSSSFAAETASPEFLHEGFGSNAFNALFFLILVEVAVVLYYVRLIRLFLVRNDIPVEVAAKAVVKTSILDKLNASVSVEKEEAIMTDHDYDGIRELDNALPPWWKYGFYVSIVWAFAYLIHYHVTHTGPSSAQEYAMQNEEAEIQMAEYRKKAANLVDESNVVLLTDAAAIEKGKATFNNNCVACHGAFGEGKVGPNLTDAYWKHGGDIKDVFTTVKYGVAGTGMKSWKADLSPSTMAEVASYILTLQGTNPAGAKEPEGELYTPAAASDSTTVAPQEVTANPTDSIK